MQRKPFSALRRAGSLVLLVAFVATLLTKTGAGADGTSVTSSYVPLTPVRVLDTRSTGSLGPHGVQDLPLGGTNGVPMSATGVMLNVTVANGNAPSYLTIWPTGQSRPNASNLNWDSASARPNFASVALGSAGRVSLYNDAGSADVIVDLAGYFVATGGSSSSGAGLGVGATGPPGATGPTGATGVAGASLDPLRVATLRWYDADQVGPIVSVGAWPWGGAFDGRYVWVANNGTNTVMAIDPTTKTVVDTQTVGTAPEAIAFDGQDLWVANSASNTVTHLHRPSNVKTTITVGTKPEAIAFDGRFVWVANTTSNTVSKIDPLTDSVVATVSVPPTPRSLAFDGTRLWVGTNAGAVLLNPATAAITTTLNSFTNSVGLAYDGSSMWVANESPATVTRVDIATLAVSATIAVGSHPKAVAFDGTRVWVANYGANTVLVIDRDTNTVRSSVGVGSQPRGLVFDGTNVWAVMAESSGRVFVL